MSRSASGPEAFLSRRTLLRATSPSRAATDRVKRNFRANFANANAGDIIHEPTVNILESTRESGTTAGKKRQKIPRAPKFVEQKTDKGYRPSRRVVCPERK